ncbi:hypothetical protein EYF80_059970 [Liparis tanakae]|uniref:Uncharacterized protein n=1 Tax=Liparis tanakae TaxID=230148 RepID=A0A4Z2EMS4_9TELE|nr:hypothetical protein EYF80_059970 [Liparis tanakae]
MEMRIIHLQPHGGTTSIPNRMMSMEPSIQNTCTESMLGHGGREHAGTWRQRACWDTEAESMLGHGGREHAGTRRQRACWDTEAESMQAESMLGHGGREHYRCVLTVETSATCQSSRRHSQRISGDTTASSMISIASTI